MPARRHIGISALKNPTMVIFLKRFIINPLLFLGISNNLYGQVREVNRDSQILALERTIPDLIKSADIPGISAALINNGKIVWVKTYGFSNKEHGIKAKNSTIFPAASLGKPVFAYAVLKLAGEGKLDLDSPVVHYLPLSYLEEIYLKGSLVDQNLKQITPRMILSHSSGLPNWRNPDGAIKTLFSPGSRYSYSGEGYFLLQLMIEYMVKQSLQDWMAATVFKPLGMKNSTYESKKNREYTTVYGTDGIEITAEANEKANVAYSFKTTAYDYAVFLQVLMKGKGLNTALAKEMMSPQIITDICGQGKISWGLGFALRQEEGETIFFQWGKSPNSSGYAIGFKNSQNALVYFTNIAGQGLRIGEKMVSQGLNYNETLFSCFGVKPY
jgi:CubicO group peptidase (beta-lactamase class C family)